MNNIRINLDILLPEIPNERDEFVTRIIKSLEFRKGIDKVHIVPEERNKKAQLCFHYDPLITSISKVEQLAKRAGAEITAQYGHLLIETSGVRHARHARTIEDDLERQKGIQHVSVSGTGFIQLEFDKKTTSEETIIQQIKNVSLSINDIEDVNVHEHKEDKQDHELSHGGIFGGKTELIFAIICGALLGIGFGLSFVKGLSEYVSIGL